VTRPGGGGRGCAARPERNGDDHGGEHRGCVRDAGRPKPHDNDSLPGWLKSARAGSIRATSRPPCRHRPYPHQRLGRPVKTSGAAAS
jgi:hypothetical protein